MTKAEQIERAIEVLQSMLPEKVDYASMVLAPACYSGGEFVYEEEEPYLIELAIEALQQALEREKNEPLTLEQLEGMVNEPVFIKTSNEYLTMIISEIYKVDDDYRIIGFTIRGKEQTWYSFHEFYKYKKESD